MGTVFGYCRVSTPQQDHALQIDSLIDYGVSAEHLTAEIAGGTKDRPRLEALLAKLRKGDSLVVWRLDRIARSVPELYRVFQQLENKGVAFVSIKDNVDTSSATGRLLLGLLSVLSAFERDLLIERTRAGQEIAKQRGVKFGRPTKLTAAVIKQIKLAHADPSLSVEETIESLKISRSSYYNALKMELTA